MRLTLHVGMPQAGGLTLQSYLSQLGKSVSPLSAGEETMSLLLLGRTDEARELFTNRYGIPDADRPEKLKESLAGCGLDHVVLSNVFLSGIKDEEFIGNLALELDEVFDEMQAVVYLQHQTRDFPSLISQRVKSGMSSWKNIHSVPVEDYKYDDLCRRWERDIDLIVRDFGRCEDSVVDDFCHAVGLAPPVTWQQGNASYTFDETALGLMVQINQCAHPAKDHIRRQIANDLEQMQLSDHLPTLSNDLVESLSHQFEDGNAWVSEHYLDGLPLLS